MAGRKRARVAPLLLLIECIAIVAIIVALAPHHSVPASHSIAPSISSRPPTTTTPTTTPPPPSTTPLPTTTVPTLTAKQKAAITVRVGNATHVANLAGTITSALSDLGFDALAPTNAPDLQSTSQILTIRSTLSGAKVIAKMLGLPDSAIKVVSSEPKFPAAVSTDIAIYAGTNLSSFAN